MAITYLETERADDPTAACSSMSRVERRRPRRVCLIRGFEVCLGDVVLDVPANVERVVAFLAVRERPQLRSTVAATLWMDTTDERASANLRTALWKARQAVSGWIVATSAHLGLAPNVETDLAKVTAQARRLVAADSDLDESDTDTDPLIGNLLPEWDEDWILFERERFRQLRVHALESLCQKLSARGRHGEAIDAGLAAVAAEPLRESAQRTLIAAHLAEGNLSEARRQYALYRGLLRESLGIEPSESLQDLVSTARR